MSRAETPQDRIGHAGRIDEVRDIMAPRTRKDSKAGRWSDFVSGRRGPGLLSSDNDWTRY